MERSTRQQLWRSIDSGILDKAAELANTYDMPAQHVPADDAAKNSKATIRKVGAAGDAETQLTLAEALEGKQPASLPQMGPLTPHVNVSSQEPPKLVQEKKAAAYALPDRELYPLDSYGQVKAATAYFMDHFKFMEPSVRHEYCMNLVKRASALDAVTNSLIEKYGSANYAPASDIQVCLEARRSNLLDEGHVALLDKLAERRNTLPPEAFAATLEQFDKVACLEQHYGGDIPDAYYTTFGKTAKKEEDPLAAIVIGNEYLTRRRLAEFAQNNVGALSTRFGADMAKDFAKDPDAIFDSLPRDQKLVIMRLANNNDSPVGQGVPTA